MPDASRMKDLVSAALQRGERAVVFQDGTSTHGDRTLLSTLHAACGMNGLRVRLVFAPPIAPGTADQRTLVCAAHAAVRRNLGSSHC